MTARPFPIPIGIGLDVCRVERVGAILRDARTRNRWARKIFNRLEWPHLYKRLQRMDDSIGELAGQDDEEADEQKVEVQDQAVAKDHDNTVWMLPGLSRYSSIFKNENLYNSAIADERSDLGRLARHLAGRWAAKEAAIKAHRYRRLFLQDVSVVTSAETSTLSLRLESGFGNLVALIDPSCDRIAMSPRVATRRGLRGFTPASSGLYQSSLMTKDELRLGMWDSQSTETDHLINYYRKSYVKSSDRQVAKLSISHDGDYAVATCIAADHEGSAVPEQTINDYGVGPSFHEPEWGDEGWPMPPFLMSDDNIRRVKI